MPADPVVSPADTPALVTAFNRHYTQVCRCEWNDEGPAGGSRETTNAECVIHGSAPNPLAALLAVGERDKASIERLSEVAEAARAFVQTTSYYRQRKESQPEFEALAVALLKLDADLTAVLADKEDAGA